MKKWFSKHKKSILLSLAGTLLPALAGLVLWNQLPDAMVTHWGADGVADGMSGKAFAVFGLPAILALLDLLALLVTAVDPKQSGQNKKAMGMVFWIMPLLSWAVCCTMFAVAMGKTVDFFVILPLMLGLMFLMIGNYLPKVRQNSTLGIKISWTLRNEENWNKTHRLAGKMWVIGGLVMLLTLLLPTEWLIEVMLVVCLVMIVVPMIYSYSIYRRHKAQGVDYATLPVGKGQKTAVVLTVVLLIVIFSGVAVLMFTGDITYTAGESSLKIEATYEKNLDIPYAQIDGLEYREIFDMGARTFGFASAKLSMGTFQNEEWGNYTLYAYNGCESMIVIRSGDKYLALNAETAEETQALYEMLLQKIGA